MATGTSAWAVIITTGSTTPRRFSSACSSSPLIPGIRMSSSRHPGRRASKSPRKRCAEGKLDTSMPARSEEHTSELQSLMRISYAVFCLKKKKMKINTHNVKRIYVLHVTLYRTTKHNKYQCMSSQEFN